MAESVRETGGRSSSHQIDNRRVDFTIAPSSRPEVINQDHLDQAKGPWMDVKTFISLRI